MNDIPEWLRALAGLIVGGGATAVFLRKWLVQYISAGVDVKAVSAQSNIFEQIQEQMRRMQEEHTKMSQALSDANNLLIRVQRKLVFMELMLARMHGLLIKNNIIIPKDIEEHLSIIKDTTDWQL